MIHIKEILQDRTFIKWSVFCTITATLLYILYFIIKNLHNIMSTAGSAVSSFLSALTPLFIGLIIAYLLSPLVEAVDQKIMAKVIFKLPKDPIKQERRKNLRRLISILITFVLIIALICLIIYAFAFLILGKFVFVGVQQLADDVIDYFTTYERVIRNWAATALPQDRLNEKINTIFNSFTNWFTNNFSTASIINFITSLGGSIFNLVIGMIISIYLLKDKQFFLGLWRKLLHLTLPQKPNAIVSETLHEINGVFSLFIRGALLDSLIVAILSSIGLSVLGLQFAVFIGCFAGICNIIPYFGPILGMIPAFIVGTFTEGLTQGIIAVGILLLIQQLDANLIYPRIVGASTGLHPLFVLLAVTIAGYYSGILGMIIAVPIACIVQIFILKWVYWLESRNGSKS